VRFQRVNDEPRAVCKPERIARLYDVSCHFHPHFHRTTSSLATRFAYRVFSDISLSLVVSLSLKPSSQLCYSVFSIAFTVSRHFAFTMKLLTTLLLILPGLLSVFAVATTGDTNDVVEASVTEECRNGDEKCSVLPLILLGRHSIKRCINHNWIDVTICNAEEICKPEVSPHCTSQTAETRNEAANTSSTDEDAIDAVSSS
jgi:hypothetical protein